MPAGSATIGTGRTVHFAATGFPRLQNGVMYEGWAIINGKPVSTGKFNVNASSQPVNAQGQLIPSADFATNTDLTAATAFVVTIEPAIDPDPGPTATHFLAGDVANRAATLTTAGIQAFGNSFAAASGTFVLATPSNGMGADEKSGIWFVDLTSGAPRQGLNLPTLPAGWNYEGWAILNGTPVSTGKFTDPGKPDLAAPFTGLGSVPPFPGEDFLNNAPAGLAFPIDISGMTVAITIEPDPDDSPAPFMVKPLFATVPTGAADHVTYPLTNGANALPTATATIK